MAARISWPESSKLLLFLFSLDTFTCTAGEGEQGRLRSMLLHLLDSLIEGSTLRKEKLAGSSASDRLLLLSSSDVDFYSPAVKNINKLALKKWMQFER